MSRYLMGILGAVALMSVATSDASAQLVERLNDLLFGPLRSPPEETASPDEESIPLEEAGRLVQRQTPINPDETVSTTGDSVLTQTDSTIDPQSEPTIAPPQNDSPSDETDPAPATGEAPEAIPALW